MRLTKAGREAEALRLALAESERKRNSYVGRMDYLRQQLAVARNVGRATAQWCVGLQQENERLRGEIER